MSLTLFPVAVPCRGVASVVAGIHTRVYDYLLGSDGEKVENVQAENNRGLVHHLIFLLQLFFCDLVIE